ncbi:Eimeria-specific protein, related [Eimeria necatrix]|uniref:Eimeria-specific protein n=1 Tax=Eimeria necatrix TaxID=51315 RepID=U6MR38_9EIME|nr:Eimeria-specific protein, related [Eimeria necatrix]WMD29386.1 Eimeria-specific protein [Eimeria necatrix]CDJ66672.1 Eimeria-specific protein, related [Eimeria necatrix]
MKGLFFTVALGAAVAVNASEDGSSNSGNKMKPEDLSAIFNGEGSQIDWSAFSPEALGMHLNYDEMSQQELDNVVDAFIRLGLISPEERETFAASLVDPMMRSMLQTVNENWPETIQKIIKDPDYLKFLSQFQSSIDENALATIVGLKEGLSGAIRQKEQQEEGSAGSGEQ